MVEKKSGMSNKTVFKYLFLVGNLFIYHISVYLLHLTTTMVSLQMYWSVLEGVCFLDEKQRGKF